MKKNLLFLLFLSLFACKKEGSGGDATIRGYVHTQKFNSTFTQFIAEFPAKDVDVYLIYGDHEAGYDDRTRTDFNGRFEFPYLYKGQYRVYTYSKDSTFKDLSGLVPIIDTVVISGRKEIVEMDTMQIFQ